MASNTQEQLVELYEQCQKLRPVPEWKASRPLQTLIPFTKRELMPGDFIHTPIDLESEQGFTAAPSNKIPSTVSGIPFLQPTLNAVMQDAQVPTYQLIGRSHVSYEAIAHVLTAPDLASRQSRFMSATSAIIDRLDGGLTKRLEIQMLHGQRGIGTIENVVGVDASTKIFTLTRESTTDDVLQKGATIDIWSSDLKNKLNQGSSQLQVVEERIQPDGSALKSNKVIDCGIRVVEVVGSKVTVQIQHDKDLKTDFTGAHIFFETASPTSEMQGLDVIGQLGSKIHELYSISDDSEGWSAADVDCEQRGLSFADIMFFSKNGSYGDRAVVLPVWMFDSFMLKHESLQKWLNVSPTGFVTCDFPTSNGLLRLLPHKYQKHGLVHIFKLKTSRRVGPCDVELISRFGNEKKFIFESATSPASEMRAYSMQGLFVGEPSAVVRIHNFQVPK